MRPALIFLCASSALALQQCCAMATTVARNDYIQVDTLDSQFRIRMGTESFSHAAATFEYSGHSVDLVLRTADLQYYRIVNFGEVFNPLDPRIDSGLADGGLGEVGIGDFYLGIWLPVGDSRPRTDFGQYYGWVHLRPVDGKITMVGNAMSFNSRGIVVGTTTIVPEPSTTGLLVAGLIAFCRPTV